MCAPWIACGRSGSRSIARGTELPYTWRSADRSVSDSEQKPFVFDTELRLVVLTGVKVRRLAELRDALSRIPGSSVFFHTHQVYLAHNFQKPLHYNDFAIWVSQALREEALAEKLAVIDLLAFTTIRELRLAILQTIDDYVQTQGEVSQACRADEAFHFCRSRSFVLPTGIIARDVPEFFEQLPHISDATLYFHFFEARLRLGRRASDFSRWLKDQGREDLAAAIDGLNPYVRTLAELKQDIIRIGAEGGGADR